MEFVYFTLWFMVTAATIWDLRRTQLRSQAILEHVAESAARIEASAERIAAMTRDVASLTQEVLRRMS